MHFTAGQSKATNAPSHDEASRSFTRAVSSNHPLSHPLPGQGLLSSQEGLLQRTCACGGTPGVDGECAECRKTRLQRPASSHAKHETAPPIVQEALSSPGQPLDEGTRAFVEPRLGHDFSKVGIHADEGLTAATSFTIGHNFSRIPIHPPATGEIQRRSAINQPGDEYEREADHVARLMMHMPEPQLQRACPCGGGCPECRQAEQPGHEHERLRTKRAGPGGPGQTAVPPPIVHEVLRSPGRHLDPTTRAFMEPRFGVDFGAVRVHTDARAQQLSADLHADAFTLGSDIFFAADKWHPEAASGRRLIAHELAHTVQQSRGPLAIQRFVPCTRAHRSVEVSSDPATLTALSVAPPYRRPTAKKIPKRISLPAAAKIALFYCALKPCK
jgi:Domain of unknown function (DUF4157)